MVKLPTEKLLFPSPTAVVFYGTIVLRYSNVEEAEA